MLIGNLLCARHCDRVEILKSDENNTMLCHFCEDYNKCYKMINAIESLSTDIIYTYLSKRIFEPKFKG